MSQTPLPPVELPDPEATAAVGRAMAAHLVPGDVLALAGPIGAGKSVLARAVIAERLRAAGAPPEDIPSPTFTLVQTYRAGSVEMWHCDLYRLTAPEEAWELGLEDAFETAICLIEWPGILGEGLPGSALHLGLEVTGPEARRLTLGTGSADLARRVAAGLPERSRDHG